jgi:predicted  nucleic acid-binding Zn-ribbon protein
VSFEQPEQLFVTCGVCGQKITTGAAVDGAVLCPACAADREQPDEPDPDMLAQLVKLVGDAQQQVAALTAKVDRLDERLSNLLVNKPVHESTAKKMIDTRCHRSDVTLTNLVDELRVPIGAAELRLGACEDSLAAIDTNLAGVREQIHALMESNTALEADVEVLAADYNERVEKKPGRVHRLIAKSLRKWADR